MPDCFYSVVVDSVLASSYDPTPANVAATDDSPCLSPAIFESPSGPEPNNPDAAASSSYLSVLLTRTARKFHELTQNYETATSRLAQLPILIRLKKKKASIIILSNFSSTPRPTSPRGTDSTIHFQETEYKYNKYNAAWRMPMGYNIWSMRQQEQSKYLAWPWEQEAARRILQFIFPDDDEEQHDVRRKQDVLSLSQSLTSEAIADEVPVSQSPANTIHLQSQSRERDDVPTRTTVIDTPTIVTDSASVDGTDRPSTSTAQTTDGDVSTTLVPPRPFKKHKQDKSIVVDWMGSWWAEKPR
ncbi:hypothetical protein JOM56_015472 [Amanita muscaria]